MAKKRNRRTQKSSGRKPINRPSLSESEDTLPDETSSPEKAAGQGAVAQTRQEAAAAQAAAQLEQEYGYVARDLRRVFLLAGAMFALLIALNLLLS
jgi:hypothetical protein